MLTSSLKKLCRCIVATSAIVPLTDTFVLSAWAQGNPDRNAYFGETHVHTS